MSDTCRLFGRRKWKQNFTGIVQEKSYVGDRSSGLARFHGAWGE